MAPTTHRVIRKKAAASGLSIQPSICACFGPA
jgi:hypothetical protein